eukprot:scaffold46152_cov19-Tisochrysis_lutea.AAC.1
MQALWLQYECCSRLDADHGVAIHPKVAMTTPLQSSCCKPATSGVQWQGRQCSHWTQVSFPKYAVAVQ